MIHCSRQADCFKVHVSFQHKPLTYFLKQYPLFENPIKKFTDPFFKIIPVSEQEYRPITHC